MSAGPGRTVAEIAGRAAVYHGSVVAHHGRCVPVELCDCERCWDEWDTRCAYSGQVPSAATARWVLRLPGGGELLHVRPASFTPNQEPPADGACSPS